MVRVIADRVNGLFRMTKIDLGVVGEPHEIASRDAAMSLERVRKTGSRVGEQPLERADFDEGREADLAKRTVEDRLLGALADGLGRPRTKLWDALSEPRTAEEHLQELAVCLALVSVESEFFEQVVLHALDARGGRHRVEKTEVLARCEVRARERLEERIELGARGTALEQRRDLGRGHEDLDLLSISGLDRLAQTHSWIVPPDGSHRKQNAAEKISRYAHAMSRSRADVLRGPLARAAGSTLASLALVAPFWPRGAGAALLSSVLNAAANLTQPDFSPTDEGPAEDHGTAKRIVLTVNATQIAALLEHAWLREGVFPAAPWVVAWFLAAAGGIALRAWAVRTLDRHFTWHVTIVDGHRLVTGGPYRWFRHPSYVGALVAYVAFPMAIGSWFAALLAYPALLDAFRRRIRLEETRLAAHFGDEWTTFARRVGSSWPGT